MADIDQDKPMTVFATIHFKSENRPDGYTPEEIDRINHELNKNTKDTMTRASYIEMSPDHYCEWCNVSKSLWKHIDREAPYHWAVSQAAQDNLAEFLDENVGAIFQGDLAEQNRNLRTAISGRMEPDSPHQTELWEWVIASWGGIHRGLGAIEGWRAQLGDLGHEAVNDFVNQWGTARISSWSKVLAFADFEKYAIYDARTAVALNCALRAIRDLRRFDMPYSRNGVISRARRELVNRIGDHRRGYSAYLALLRCLAYHKCALDILAAEMVIFANAEVVAAAVDGD